MLYFEMVRLALMTDASTVSGRVRDRIFSLINGIANRVV